MSGFGAPRLTARPAPERAMSARVAPTSLPCLTRSSVMGVLRIATSNAAPFSISALSGTAALKVNESLCSVAFSNCGASSSSAVFMAFEAKTLISAAWPAPAVNSASANANSFPAMSAGVILMASSKDRRFELVVVKSAIANLPVNPRDRQELVGLEARTADQGAVNIRDAHQLPGIRGFHRSAVEDSGALPWRSQSRYQSPPDMLVHLGDIAGGWCQPGPDGPDRLVGNNKVLGCRAFGHRTIHLGSDHRERPSILAFGPALADADDGAESGAPCGQRFCAHVRIGFLVIDAPLRVPDDDRAGPGIPEHFGRQISGEGPCRLGVTVLRADP